MGPASSNSRYSSRSMYKLARESRQFINLYFDPSTNETRQPAKPHPQCNSSSCLVFVMHTYVRACVRYMCCSVMYTRYAVSRDKAAGTPTTTPPAAASKHQQYLMRQRAKSVRMIYHSLHIFYVFTAACLILFEKFIITPRHIQGFVVCSVQSNISVTQIRN